MASDRVIFVVDTKTIMSVDEVRSVAIEAMNQTSDFENAIRDQAFLLLCWNLQVHSRTVSSMAFGDISLHNNALLISIPKQKQRELSPNLEDPTMCPILWLALLVFSSISCSAERFLQFL